MARKRNKPEETIAKLRQVDVLTAQGQSMADAIRSIGVTEVAYYCWRHEYGGFAQRKIVERIDPGAFDLRFEWRFLGGGLRSTRAGRGNEHQSG